MSHQPHRVRLALPDGGGVLLEPVCALCREAVDGMTCPICSRMFCVEGCFEVHLNARDQYESREAINRFLLSPMGEPFRNLVEEHTDGPVDWKHARDCTDCGAALHETLMEVLFAWLQDVQKECESEV